MNNQHSDVNETDFVDIQSTNEEIREAFEKNGYVLPMFEYCDSKEKYVFKSTTMISNETSQMLKDVNREFNIFTQGYKTAKQSAQSEIELLNEEKVHYFDQLQEAQKEIKELKDEFKRVDSEKDDLLLELSKRDSRIKELECKYACDRRDSTSRCNMDCSRNSNSEIDLFEEKK